jgi:hypothetical protein
MRWEVGVKQPGHEDNQSLSFTAKIKNAWSYTPVSHMPSQHAHGEL